MTNRNTQRTEMVDSRRDFFSKANNLTLGTATTVPPGYPGAVHICPNIYTTPYELDLFVAAMKELAA